MDAFVGRGAASPEPRPFFGFFSALLDGFIQEARRDGKYDEGVMQLRASSLKTDLPDTCQTHVRSFRSPLPLSAFTSPQSLPELRLV